MRHCANPQCDHLARHGRIAEYLESVALCSDCGSRLVAGEAPRRDREAPAYQELVTVYEAADGIQAHLVRSVLENEGIPVSIRGEALMGAVGELPATMLDVEVQVPPEFAARARSLALRCEPGSRRPMLARVEDDDGPG